MTADHLQAQRFELKYRVPEATACTAREFIRVVGEDRVRRIFFGPLEQGPVL